MNPRDVICEYLEECEIDDVDEEFCIIAAQDILDKLNAAGWKVVPLNSEKGVNV